MKSREFPLPEDDEPDETGSAPALAPLAAYARDVAERTVLFLDTLRRRDNAFAEQARAGEPVLLKFAHETVIDGRTLARPCNYTLLHILPLPEVATDEHARPLVVVDPRAGHGPGIGGFKSDSEVGIALRAGHPVYFVSFRSQPEEGQTLNDVMAAEAHFLEEIARRHPGARGKPVVIGNCQAGWAMAELDAVRPELFGPLILVGSPLSYWAGSSSLNPMRYAAGALGGAWLAALSADLGGDRFDGANLVANFERLNPANSFWNKYYALWADVDAEAERFLDFERWWGGFFRMTGAEIESIVENRFIGNRLAAGSIVAGDGHVDLRRIESPVIVFCSWGDNITPPPQALNWIIDAWGDERAIAAAGRVIVYVLHETVGHLGIFVGAQVARKEHDQMVSSLDIVEHLPPGLYEMKVVPRDRQAAFRWEDLEPGSYSVHFEPRTMQALRQVNPEGREEERLFSTIAQLSAINTALYKSCVRPWVRALVPPALGRAAAEFHPLRLQRKVWADAENASAPLIAQLAQSIRARRRALPEDSAWRAWERSCASLIEQGLENYRRLRDQSMVQWTRLAFGPYGLGAWLPPQKPLEVAAAERAADELARAREDALARIDAGGYPQAVCRIALAAMISSGALERRSLRVARLLARLQRADRPGGDQTSDWQSIMRAEARISSVAPLEAIEALPRMLPDTSTRENALAAAAAVLMIEPTLDNPRSEIIELLIGMLGVDPERVMSLARDLTQRIEIKREAA